MLFLFSIVLCVLILLYFYVKKRNNYWKERGVVTVKSNLLLGTAYDFLIGRKSFEQIFNAIYWAEPNEPYVGVYNTLQPVLFLRDPELIHQITVKDFSHFHDRQEDVAGLGRLSYHLFVLSGQEWKDVRNKLVLTFSASKLKKMYDLIEESVEMVVDQHFRPPSKTGKPVNVKETMERFSLDVIGKCAFGLQFNTLNESNSLYLDVGKVFTSTGLINTLRLAILFLNPKMIRYVGIDVTPKKIVNFFFNLLHGAEELRRRDSQHRTDMLQHMLDLKSEGKFSEEHVASNMFAFYSAGFEPTAHTIVFALYEISFNVEIQEKLRAEIKKTREDNNGVLDYTTLKKCTYLEMVVSETLRLHGTAPVQSRVCTKAYRLPGTSVEIKVGQKIFYSSSAIQKDEKYFPDPLKFDPERFSEENIARMTHSHTYFPWGNGPRTCVGSRFATLEIKICLAAILSHFKLSLNDKTEVPIALQKSFFHSPKNGVWLTIEEIDRI